MKTYTLSDLAIVDCASASVEYNTAGADMLTISGLAPAWVESLGWERWEKIVLTDDAGVPLFVGRVTEGREMAAQGGSTPTSTFVAQSDFATLEMTSYTDINAQGIPTLAAPFVRKSGKTPTVSMAKVLQSCFSGALGKYMCSTLECSLDGQTIPMGQTGGTSCAQLMLSALEWAPDAVIRMGYADADSDGAGLVMHIDQGSSLAPVAIAASGTITEQGGASLGACDGIADISLRPRHDLILPAAALIGAQHYSVGGDPREPGAFVYCVTREKPSESDDLVDNVPAYTAPDEKKTIITGLPVPPRSTLNGSGYKTLRAVDADTHKVLAYCFPLLDKIGVGNYEAGAPLIAPTPLKTLRPNNTPVKKDKDEGNPANYDTAFISLGQAHIHIDGTFPASARPSRNISGLKWCKGEIRLVVAVDALPAGLTRDEAESFFKGKKKDDSGNAWRYADLTIQCTLINSARRIVKGTKPLSGDSEYQDGEEEAQEPEPDYKALLDSYYYASQQLCHEGQLTLVAPRVHPSSLLGRSIRVVGMESEWESMTAICRSLSFDLMSRRMTLSLGSRDTLGWDMRLERAQMGLQREQNQRATERITDPLTPQEEGSEGEEEETEADALMVSPSITASIATTSDGRPHRAFELYEMLSEDNSSDSGVWVMQGGSVWVGKTEIKIPTTKTQMIDGKADAPFGDPKTEGKRKLRVYQKSDESGKNVWTYDVTQDG